MQNYQLYRVLCRANYCLYYLKTINLFLQPIVKASHQIVPALQHEDNVRFFQIYELLMFPIYLCIHPQKNAGIIKSYFPTDKNTGQYILVGKDLVGLLLKLGEGCGNVNHVF